MWAHHSEYCLHVLSAADEQPNNSFTPSPNNQQVSENMLKKISLANSIIFCLRVPDKKPQENPFKK